MLKSSSGLERDDAHSPRSLKPCHQPNLKTSPPVDELSVLEGAKEGVAADLMSVSIVTWSVEFPEDHSVGLTCMAAAKSRRLG